MSTDPEGTRLRAAVVDAKADFRTVAASMTPAASLLLASNMARGPLGRGAEDQATRRLVDAYQAADKHLRAARVALHEYDAAQRETERLAMMEGYRERCERKTAALVAAGHISGTSVQVIGPYGRPR